MLYDIYLTHVRLVMIFFIFNERIKKLPIKDDNTCQQHLDFSYKTVIIHLTEMNFAEMYFG